MCIAYLVVFRYFGCFWISNRGETEQKVRMPNDTFSKSTLSQPWSPARANHSIATPEKLAAQFHSIAKPEESPHQNHSITTLWYSLDRTLSEGRWTIQSWLHCISLDRKAEPLQPSLINDILDHRKAHFSPSDANDTFGRRVMTWRFAIYLVSLFVSFLAYINCLLGFSRGHSLLSRLFCNFHSWSVSPATLYFVFHYFCYHVFNRCFAIVFDYVWVVNCISEDEID